MTTRYFAPKLKGTRPFRRKVTLLTDEEIDELVFQVLVSRMTGKARYHRPISEATVVRLCQAMKSVLEDEPIVLRIPSDLAIVGDIHGNINDLLRIFERLHYPPAMRYLFLGDYIDRGLFGTKVLLLLFSFKVKYLDRVFMLRGNHETETLSRFYGFHKELISKYTDAVDRQIVGIFRELPLCAGVGERVFCVHGGISPRVRGVEELESLPKPDDCCSPGVFTGTVWSDPSSRVANFAPNTRGCRFAFGGSALSAFLGFNNFNLLVRSHEMCDDGIAWPFAGDEHNVERCLTVFSTSDYRDRGNRAPALYIAADMLVNVEEFASLKGEKRRVVLPYWMCQLITKKEQTRNGRRRGQKAVADVSLKLSKLNENTEVANATQAVDQ
jgi:protein phosphatase